MNEQFEDNLNHLTGASPNFKTELARQLEELVPEAIADGKVDALKLKELLGDDAGETKERFGLFWPGKTAAIRAAQEPTTATLKPAKALSKDWDSTDNIFIEGDNLEVLKVLQNQYHNKIKMIYIDPPYNTGKDFVYPDNFKEGLANYLAFSQQVDAGNKKISTNTETTGRYHSNWLNMMYPRLKLARNLLTDDGVIFISIDDAEQANLKKICDEIFGESNFVASFIWKRGGGRQDSKHIAIITEYILCYSRNINNLEMLETKKEGEVFPKFDEAKQKRYKTQLLRKWGSNSRREDRPNLFYAIKAPDGSDVFPKNGAGDGCWRWALARMLDEIEKGNVEFVKDEASGEWIAYEKIYEGERDTKKFTTIIDDISSSKSTKDIKSLMEGDYFDYPKPVELMKMFIKMVNSDDSVVLDFFAGSATTAHAVMQLNAEDGGNRKHIMVQLPEPTDEKSEAYKAGYRKISDIARERIHRAGEKIKTDFADKLAERQTPLDIGYRTYQLADTNFTKWQSNATGDVSELQARLDLMRESADDNASEEDLLCEVMLKMGLPLTARTVERDIAGLKIHQVVVTENSEELADTQPMFYLNERIKPNLEQLREVVALLPSRLVILDDALQGDNQLKTNLIQTCKSFGVKIVTV